MKFSLNIFQKKRVKFQNKENIKENPFGVLKNLNLN